MTMEAVASCSSFQHCCGEIDQLLEVFGSAFSIEYIASTYLQANRDIDRAGEILCELQAAAASTISHQPKVPRDKSLRIPTESCNSNGSELHSDVPEGDSKALNLGESPVVRGRVARVTGKEYAGPGSSTSKQLRLGGSLLPMVGLEESMISEFSCKTFPSSGAVTTEIVHKDIDEFLFKMLGDGFQLDMKVIHEVLSTCGYDMEKVGYAIIYKVMDTLNYYLFDEFIVVSYCILMNKQSMETLLDISASSFGKSDDILSGAAEVPSESYEEVMDLACQPKSQQRNSGRMSKKRNKEKNDLEKELLQSLFTVSKRQEEEPKKIHPRKEVSRSGRFGKVVSEPLKDTPIEQKTLYVTPLQASKDEDEDEDSFQVLRRAVKEHWATMKEYYKAAGEAFLKGDHVRANRLMDEGHCFSRKAREVDEMSVQKIVETREEELLLDLSILEPKESVQHLRSQLVNLSGIPSIPYLKIKLGTGGGGAKEGSRKRLISKLLDKESVKWTEMEDGQTISIRLDEINPKSLSFSRK